MSDEVYKIYHYPLYLGLPNCYVVFAGTLGETRDDRYITYRHNYNEAVEYIALMQKKPTLLDVYPIQSPEAE